MSSDLVIAAATSVAALGTVGAVAIALFVEPYRKRRLRPKLEMNYDPVERRRNLDLVTVGPADDLVHWVRLRVSNAKGRRSAEGVEVFLTRCERSDTGIPQAPVNERPLSWSGERQSDGRKRVTRTLIPPGVTRHVNLLSIEREGGEGKASLRVVPKLRDGRHKISQGKFDIELVLAAKDVNAKIYRGSIAYDGDWADGDEIWQHVAVQIEPAG